IGGFKLALNRKSLPGHDITSFFLSFFVSFASFASFAVRFFLVLKYGLAHLHTELVLVYVFCN
ncbi:hypothetical protein FACHB389_34455, partial [Nostoc calcicola FACHB-389]